MMASLRHPSIVMYLGVCLDPPAVVTEYCARGESRGLGGPRQGPRQGCRAGGAGQPRRCFDVPGNVSEVPRRVGRQFDTPPAPPPPPPTHPPRTPQAR